MERWVEEVIIDFRMGRELAKFPMQNYIWLSENFRKHCLFLKVRMIAVDKITSYTCTIPLTHVHVSLKHTHMYMYDYDTKQLSMQVPHLYIEGLFRLKLIKLYLLVTAQEGVKFVAVTTCTPVH